jgi:GNAT superfamily N-acetyltransferase
MAELNRHKRQVLRQIQEHFNTTRKRRGVLFEQASTVDVYHHPRDTAALYNYITPRRGVAWVPGKDVKFGLDRLAELERIPRLELVKGLFPPAFHAQMEKLGLEVESDYPLLTYGIVPNCDQTPPDVRPVPPASRDLAVYGVADQNGVARWISLNLEGQQPDAAEVRKVWDNVLRGHEMYFLVSHELTLAGGASVILNPPVAQIQCADTLMPYRRRGVASAAIRMALQFAQAKDCSLIFMVGTSSAATHLYRRLGFVDLDNVITYCRPPAAEHDNSHQLESDPLHARNVAQPVPPRR